MLTSEFIQAVERFIDRFGFPIFVALVALVFFWKMFDYMKTTVKKKDDDFCGYVERATQAMADYVAKRDEQVSRIVDNHNSAFRENSHALARLSDSIELRIHREITKERAERRGADGGADGGEKLSRPPEKEV
jgi:hypothetical protein